MIDQATEFINSGKIQWAIMLAGKDIQGTLDSVSKAVILWLESQQIG
jgi:hypothetical protein